MEPALRKRVWDCPEWRLIMNLRRQAAYDPNLSRSSAVHGRTVTITAVQKSYLFPAVLRYELDGLRLTPAVFADTFNEMINAARAAKPEPIGSEYVYI